MTTTVTLAHRPPQWQQAARQVLVALAQRAAWFWAGASVLCAIVLLVVSRFAEVSLSGMQFAHQGALWFQFAMAISVVAVYLPVHVAAGTTRRSFLRGALIASFASAIGYAAAFTVLLLVERQIYGALGWYHGNNDVSSGTALVSGAWFYLGGTMLIYLAGTISGLLVGAVYYRFGGIRGTLALPLTLAPVLLVSIFAPNSASQWSPLGGSANVSGWWQPLAAVVLVAAATVILHLLVRRIPIR